MSISGTDIISQVLQAAQPNRASQATLALKQLAPANRVNGSSILPVSIAGTANLSAPTSIQTSTVQKPFREFEALLLKDAISNMMPKEADSVYGNGMTGGFWKDWMADAVSRQIAESGGIGLAETLYHNYSNRFAKAASADAENAVQTAPSLAPSLANAGADEEARVPSSSAPTVWSRLQDAFAEMLLKSPALTTSGAKESGIALDERYKWFK